MPHQEPAMHCRAPEAPLARDDSVNESNVVSARAVRHDFTCPTCKKSGLPPSFSVAVQGRYRDCHQCIECRAASALDKVSRRPNGPFHGVSQLGLQDAARSYVKQYFQKWEKKLPFPRPRKEVVDDMVLNVIAQFEAKHRDNRESAISSSSTRNVSVQAEGDILNPPNVVQFISDTENANSTRSAQQIEDSVEADTNVQKTISEIEEVYRTLQKRYRRHGSIPEKLEKDEEHVFAGFLEQYEKFARPWISIADILDKMHRE